MAGKSPRVVVLGTGVSGLSCAYELVRRSRQERVKIDLVVLEAAQRVGGKILTENKDGAVIEGGPDSFVTFKPEALELAGELGLSAELIRANPSRTAVWIYRNGKLRAIPAAAFPWPSSPLALLFSPLLSWRGKARMALEPFIPGGRDRGDESLACFIRRRLGSEALEAFIGPMLAGIYAGDPERMSLESVFPRLKDLEGRGGFFRSLRRGRGSPFVTLRGGLSRLTEGLARALPPGVVRTGTKVLSLRRENSVWIIRTDRGVYEAEAVIPTLPAWALAEILEEADMELACALREIPFASSATVSLIYARDELPRLPEGFGFLPAHGENLRIGGATFSSSKFPQRAPCGKVLIRCFFSGAAPGSLAEAPPETLVRAAAEDLSRVLGLGGAKPEFSRVFRWDRSNPQYTIGHALRLKRIDSCRLGHPGLYLAGCSYEGIGIPDCVRSGRRAGAEAFRFCSGPRPGSHQRRLAYV